MGVKQEVKVFPVDAQVEACWAEHSAMELEYLIIMSGLTAQTRRNPHEQVPKRLDSGTHHYTPSRLSIGNQAWLGNPRDTAPIHELDVLLHQPVQGVAVETIIGPAKS